MTPISKYFSSEEVTRSDTAARLGIDNAGALTDEFLQNATQLAVNILDPERDHWGLPAHISSWFRCLELNASIPGSSAISQHTVAQAADHTVPGVGLVDQFNWLAFESGLPFDQIIFEYGAWVHVSYGPRNRRSILRKDHGQPYVEVTTPLVS